MFCTFFVLLGNIAIFPQVCQKPKDGEQVIVEEAERPNLKDYKNWQEFKVKNFSFYAPKELEQKKVKCMEGGCYKFESNDLLLSISINPDASYPTSERSYSSYCEKYAWIDDSFAWLWFFEDNRNYKYNTGILFQFPEDKNRIIGMQMYSKNNIRQVSETVFKSVKFMSKKNK